MRLPLTVQCLLEQGNRVAQYAPLDELRSALCGFALEDGLEHPHPRDTEDGTGFAR